MCLYAVGNTQFRKRHFLPMLRAPDFNSPFAPPSICRPTFDSPEKIVQMKPDLDKVKELEGLLLHVTAKGSETDCVSRTFAPKRRFMYKEGGYEKHAGSIEEIMDIHK